MRLGSRDWCCVLGLTLVLLAAAKPAARAENLVQNGEFDIDTQGWELVGAGTEPDWLTVDHDACGVDSGSARAENSHPSATLTLGYRTCAIGLAGGAPYSLDGFLRIPSGQSRSGSVWISVSWFDSPLDCSGAFLGVELTSQLPSTNPDVWTHKVRRDLTSPADTQSAEIRVAIYKEEAGGTLLANFDGIHLVEGNGYLFGDGFDSDTLCRWTEAVP